MVRDELLQEKIADWGYTYKSESCYEYTVFCAREAEDGFLDEMDETFNNLDEALDYRDDMITAGWDCKIKQYNSNGEGTELKI